MHSLLREVSKDRAPDAAENRAVAGSGGIARQTQGKSRRAAGATGVVPAEQCPGGGAGLAAGTDHRAAAGRKDPGGRARRQRAAAAAGEGDRPVMPSLFSRVLDHVALGPQLLAQSRAPALAAALARLLRVLEAEHAPLGVVPVVRQLVPLVAAGPPREPGLGLGLGPELVGQRVLVAGLQAPLPAFLPSLLFARGLPERVLFVNLLLSHLAGLADLLPRRAHSVADRALL